MPRHCTGTDHDQLYGTVVDPIFVKPDWSLEETYFSTPRAAIFTPKEEGPALFWSLVIGVGIITVLGTAAYVVAAVIWHLARSLLAL